MKAMSNMRQDFVATHLRSQVSRLNAVLGVIEDQGEIDCDYTHESLKEIEINIRQIRKLCANH
ncbi:hypothetical protein D4Q80_03510 [bacterium]|nr:MAG: hypothetical protein D4Q80_03510 [bacterium]